MKEAEPQQGRRLDPPLLDLSLNPTLVDAVRQLDGTGANGPRRPPAGAVRLHHAERPDSWPMPEDPPFGSTPQKDSPSAPNRLPLPSSAHCTATPVAAWRRVIASPLVALASKSAACRMWGGAGPCGCWPSSSGGHVSRSARIAHAPTNQSRSASTRRGRFTRWCSAGLVPREPRHPRRVRFRLTRFSGRSHIALERWGRVTRFLASVEAAALPRRGLMLSENACGSPAEARLPARTGCPGSARRANLSDAHPYGVSAADAQVIPPAWPISREPSTRLLDASARPRAARDPSQVAMTSPDRAPHEPASPVASNGTEADGEVPTCP